MPELATFIIAGLTFLLAGVVKGVIGLGLPSVSLALLTVAIDLPSAMALMLVPSFVTNAWQAMRGGQLVTLLQRLWPFFLAATVTIWLGAMAFPQINAKFLSSLLGLLLAFYAIVNLAGYRFSIDVKHQRLNGPVLGAVNGLLTGLTGSFVVPGVMFLQAIGLSRDVLVQAMGILFTLSTIALAIAMQSNQLIDRPLTVLSILSALPAIIGMWIGQKFRATLSERTFKQIFFWSLLMLAVYILATINP